MHKSCAKKFLPKSGYLQITSTPFHICTYKEKAANSKSNNFLAPLSILSQLIFEEVYEADLAP